MTDGAPLRELRDGYCAAVLTGEIEPAELPDLLASAADRWIIELFEAAGGGTAPAALVAVGGYGRGELCPGSDLDLVLIHEDGTDVSALAERLFYAIWDGGLRLDHSVRTPDEATALARADLRVMLGLLDGRHLAGSALLAASVIEECARLWQAHSGELLGDLQAAADERRRRFGELAFLLEPDLKESAGGLRDVDVLGLGARALPHLAAVLNPPALDQHRRLLLAARVALQCRTRSAGNRLLLQEQEEVGRLLGMSDADALMAAVSAAGRETLWARADGWRRMASSIAGPIGRRGGRDIALGGGVVWRDGEIALPPDGGQPGDAGEIVAVAVAAAARGAPIATATLRRLLETRPADEPWARELRDGFVSLLEYGEAAVPVIEVLDQHRLFERLLPEWLAVRHRPQRNAYHRFTVDRHLLETAAQAAGAMRNVSRPDLLLLGALLHDIGKGHPGDHSSTGADLAAGIVHRMGFAPGDVEVVVRLVRHHLLLADTATRRDLADPATAALVAAAVGDRLTLELLAALTEADSLATGPSAWSAWKAGLVEDLVGRTLAVLTGSSPPADSTGGPSAHHLELARRGGLEVELDDTTLTVVADDRPGLLALVAGTLALHRLEIRAATAFSAGTTSAVEIFELATPQPAASVVRIREDLARAISGELLLAARMADLERDSGAPRRPVAAVEPTVRVLVDTRASARSTVVEVRAPDGRGLLYRLAQVLAEGGVDVVSARVSTLGHEVVDAFYLRRPGGGAPPSAHELEGIVARLTEVAQPPAR